MQNNLIQKEVIKNKKMKSRQGHATLIDYIFIIFCPFEIKYIQYVFDKTILIWR